MKRPFQQRGMEGRASAKGRIKTIFRPRYAALVKALKTARISANLSQAEVARILHRAYNYPTKIEHLDRRLDVMEFVEYAQAVGEDPIRLLRLALKAK